MLRRVEISCQEQKLFSKGDGIVIACSGGPDSLAMADMFFRWQKKWELRLCIAHFEHGIRGEASREDAHFVEMQAERWGIPFQMERADVPAYGEQHHMSLETAARVLRYKFLNEVCDALEYDWIALAHHADDQAETVLMHLLRGSGLDGMAAIRSRNGRLIRPLLYVHKKDLIAYCEERHLAPREDATNDTADGTRNRIRLELLPLMKQQYNPLVETALCQWGQIAAETVDFLEMSVQRVWKEAVRGKGVTAELSQKVFRELHPALQKALLRKYLCHIFGYIQDIGFTHMAELCRLLIAGGTGKQCELPGKRRVALDYGWLHRSERKSGRYPEYTLQVPGCTDLPAYGIRVRTELRPDCPKVTGPMEFYCDYERLTAPLMVRNRCPGDRIYLGRGTKKLKEFFIDCKVRQEVRDAIPLLVSGTDILWVMGMRRSIRFQPDQKTRCVLFIRIERKGVNSDDEG